PCVPTVPDPGRSISSRPQPAALSETQSRPGCSRSPSRLQRGASCAVSPLPGGATPGRRHGRSQCRGFFAFSDRTMEPDVLSGISSAGATPGRAVTDVTRGGLSAVYTFFDPDQRVRSLGTFAILTQIEWARRLSLPY